MRLAPHKLSLCVIMVKRVIIRLFTTPEGIVSLAWIVVNTIVAVKPGLLVHLNLGYQGVRDKIFLFYIWGFLVLGFFSHFAGGIEYKFSIKNTLLLFFVGFLPLMKSHIW
jgi:hypothetical protein